MNGNFLDNSHRASITDLPQTSTTAGTAKRRTSIVGIGMRGGVPGGQAHRDSVARGGVAKDVGWARATAASGGGGMSGGTDRRARALRFWHIGQAMVIFIVRLRREARDNAHLTQQELKFLEDQYWLFLMDHTMNCSEAVALFLNNKCGVEVPKHDARSFLIRLRHKKHEVVPFRHVVLLIVDLRRKQRRTRKTDTEQAFEMLQALPDEGPPPQLLSHVRSGASTTPQRTSQSSVAKTLTAADGVPVEKFQRVLSQFDLGLQVTSSKEKQHAAERFGSKPSPQAIQKSSSTRFGNDDGDAAQTLTFGEFEQLLTANPGTAHAHHHATHPQHLEDSSGGLDTILALTNTSFSHLTPYSKDAQRATGMLISHRNNHTAHHRGSKGGLSPRHTTKGGLSPRYTAFLANSPQHPAITNSPNGDGFNVTDTTMQDNFVGKSSYASFSGMFDPDAANSNDEETPSYHLMQELDRICGHTATGKVSLGLASSKLRDLKREEPLMAEVRHCASKKGDWNAKRRPNEGTISYSYTKSKKFNIVEDSAKQPLAITDKKTRVSTEGSRVRSNATVRNMPANIVEHQGITKTVPHPSTRSAMRPQSALARKLRAAMPSRTVDDFVGTPTYLRRGDSGGTDGSERHGEDDDPRRHDDTLDVLRRYCALHSPPHLQLPPSAAVAAAAIATTAAVKRRLVVVGDGAGGGGLWGPHASGDIDPCGTAKDALAFLSGGARTPDDINAARSGLNNARRKLLGGGGGGGFSQRLATDDDDDDDGYDDTQWRGSGSKSGGHVTSSTVVAARQRPQSAQAVAYEHRRAAAAKTTHADYPASLYRW